MKVIKCLVISAHIPSADVKGIWVRMDGISMSINGASQPFEVDVLIINRF